MRLTSFSVSNYKNFQKSRLELGGFNVIVGLNSSGKSNLVTAFSFLHNCFEQKFKRTVELSGGWESISSFYSGKASSPIKLSSEFEIQENDTLNFRLQQGSSEKKRIKAIKALAEVRLYPPKKEEIKYVYQAIVEFENKEKIKLTWDGRKTRNQASISGPPAYLDAFGLDTFAEFFKHNQMKNSDSPVTLFTSIIQNLLEIDLSFSHVGIFNFDPKIASQGHETYFSKQLDKNGRNFASLLAFMRLESEEVFRKQFLLPLRGFYPQICDVSSVVTQSGDYVVLYKEKYGGKELDLSMNKVSEGMLFVSLIIAAVKFGSDKTIVIEEPERYIHPSLLERLIQFLRGSAQAKQIIITTHSPIVVNSCELSELSIIERKTDGTSEVRRPNKKLPDDFVETMGLDQLFINKML